MSKQKEVLLEIKHLKKYFPVKTGVSLSGSKQARFVHAVEDVSFSIRRGETLGLVGESGCGKTTLGRTILRLYEPTDGQIFFDGDVLFDKKKKIAPNMLPYRRRMQIIFQDPSASLNPRMTVGEIVGEAMEIHHPRQSREQRTEAVRALLSEVGLNAEHASRYPHAFSGGQQQRVGIARALAVNPSFIVCDEPISALDLSIQSQIVNMLEDLQTEKGLTYLFIAHDLSVVRHISDRIGVMYLGALMELGESNAIYHTPLHPYTKTLLSAVPVPDPDEAASRRRIVPQGDLPSPMNPPSGCRFHTRCPHAQKICTMDVPSLREIQSGHFAACHFL